MIHLGIVSRQPGVTASGAAPENLSRALSREFSGADLLAGPAVLSSKIIFYFVCARLDRDSAYAGAGFSESLREVHRQQ